MLNMDGSTVGLVVFVVVVVGAIATWVPRLIGAVLLLDGVLTLWWNAWDFSQHALTLRIGAGLVLWLFGHLMFRLKNEGWRTKLGMMAWRRTPLRLISPS